MSLIYCSGCGQQIHETASSCPGCGAQQKSARSSSSSKMVVALVCFFLGSFGIHRFMVGKIGTGILMLLTLGLLGLWTLIDFIVILLGKFTDGEGRFIT